MKKEKQYNPHMQLSRLVLVCYCIILFPSCKQTSSSGYHPHYFDSIYTKMPASANAAIEDIYFLDAAYRKFSRPGIGDIYRKYDYKRKFFYDAHGDYQRGISYCDSIIHLLKEEADNTHFAWFLADAFFVKGDILMHTNKYEESMLMYLAGKDIVLTHLQDSCLLVEYHARLGKLMYERDDFLEAARYYKEGIEYQQRCDWDSTMKFAAIQEYLDNTGMSYSQAGMYDSAEVYFSTSLHFITNNEHRFPDKKEYIALAKAVIYGNQAEVAGKRGNTGLAELLFLKSIEGTLRDDRRFTHSTRLKLVGFYLQNNRMEKAARLLEEVKISIEEFPDEESLMNWYELMKDYYVKQNQVVRAADIMKRYVQLKDSLETKIVRETAGDISNEFEVLEQKSRGYSLRKENTAKAFFLAVITAFCILVTAILLLLWYNVRRSHRFAKTIAGLNKEIELKNQALQSAFISLEQGYKSSCEIIRTVSVNLKNCIVNIIGHTSSLSGTKAPPDFKIKLAVIETACNNSLKTINEMSQVPDNNLQPRRELMDISEVLEQCAELLRSKAEQKNQTINLITESIITGIDAHQLSRAVSNILHNAIKFSPKDTDIYITLEKKDGGALISILDEGIGIPEEIRDRVFSLETEGGRKGTDGEESYGMGLFISQRIINEQGGSIWFQNRQEKGVAFYIRLPVQ